MSPRRIDYFAIFKRFYQPGMTADQLTGLAVSVREFQRLNKQRRRGVVLRFLAGRKQFQGPPALHVPSWWREVFEIDQTLEGAALYFVEQAQQPIVVRTEGWRVMRSRGALYHVPFVFLSPGDFVKALVAQARPDVRGGKKLVPRGSSGGVQVDGLDVPLLVPDGRISTWDGSSFGFTSFGPIGRVG